METKQTRFTILMFPWLAHGHIYPYLELAKNLSNHNFNILFCSTSINLTSVREALGETPYDASIRLVELELPSSPELPPEYHTMKNLPPNLRQKLDEAFNMSKSSFSTIIASLKPDLLIYDAFQPWSTTIASSQGIPVVHFATTGAAAYSFYYHLSRNRTSPFPYEALYLTDYEQKAVSHIINDVINDDADGKHVFSHFHLSSDIILMRTCRGLEGKYIDYLSAMCPKKLVPVGPLIPPTTTKDSHSEIMQWLSNKNQFSTVFISFGSENYLSRNQMQEMAKGLEASNVNFIWVVRIPPGEKFSIEEEMPEGFLERVKDRGMIIQGWAPQNAILRNPSIGAFVSHCGMSSTIESVYYGVPVIAITFTIDQPLNAKLLVEAGIGIEVIRDNNGNFSSEEVENAINKVVFEKTGEEMRLKAAEQSRKMKCEEEYAITDVAEKLRQLCMEYKKQK